MTFHRLRNPITAMLCLLTLGAFCGGLALAAGVVPPGIIYFGQYQGDWMSMKGDGSNKKYAPIIIPSYHLHAGSRWTLQGDNDFSGPPDPLGNVPFELFAANESLHEFQLTHDPNVSWINTVPPTWGKDDSFVSFVGVKNTPSGVIGGLFVIDIDWSSGTPVASPPMLVLEAPTTTYGFWSWADVNLYRHDWSPAGDEVVFMGHDSAGASQLYVASFTPVVVATSHLTSGDHPDWSPDGSRIAFDRGEIWSIRPDGTGALRLTQASATSNSTQKQTSPSWSPDGAYLAFTNSLTKAGKTTYSVQRIAASGGAVTNLTSGLTGAYGPHWRQ